MYSYMHEISNHIESSVNQADIILQSLYDNHLKNRSPNNSDLLFQPATQKKLFGKKRKASEIMLFQPKRVTIEEIKSAGTVLDNIIHLYHRTDTSKVEKQRIIEILSAHSSYFPKEAHKLPEEIRCKLKLLNGSDLIASMIDEKMILKMLNEKKNTKGLDPFLSELPDKGKHILEKILKKLITHTFCDYYIVSLSHFPNTLDITPLSFQQKMITALVERLENITSEIRKNDPLFSTLAELSHILSKFPDMRKRALEVLHKLMLSELYDNMNDQHFDRSKSIAYCLNQVTGKSQDNVFTNKNTISHCINAMNNSNSWYVQFKACFVLKELTNLIFTCPKTTINEIIKILLDKPHHSTNISEKIKVIELLCELSPYITILPNHMIDTFIEFLQKIDWSYEWLGISKIAIILEKNPAQFEKILLDMFNACIDNKSPIRNNCILKLLYSWRHYVKFISDQGKEVLFEKLYQHFANNTYSKWMSDYYFKTLSCCYEHMPNATKKLMEFFVSQLENSNDDIRTYAIHAIGCLQFSLAALPDSGLSILTKMKEILHKINNGFASDIDTDALCFALGNMSNCIAEHPEFMQPIIMELCALIPSKILDYTFFISMHKLYQDFKHALTPEDKQKIYQKYEKNYNNFHVYDDFFGIFSHAPNKKAILDQKLKSYALMDPSEILLKIAFNLQNHHPQQLSWFCAIKNYMRQNQVMDNVYNFSLLFLEIKRKELLSKKLPMELVNHIETFVSDNIQNRISTL